MAAVARIALVRGETEVILGRVVDVRPDLALVQALARLHLAAGRVGCSIRLREPCDELAALLDLIGLTDVLVTS